jgi:hypothetical protein
LLLSGVVFLAGCGGGTLAEGLPSRSAGSLAVKFDAPLTIGTITTAHAVVVTRTADGRQIATLTPVEASRVDTKGLLVAGSSDRGNIYIRMDDREIVITWTSLPDED